jgi:hypothetical protein
MVAAARDLAESTDVGEQIAADPDGSRIVGTGRYCPGTLPCPGRPANTIAVPVRRVSDRDTLGDIVGEIQVVLCPICQRHAVDK